MEFQVISSQCRKCSITHSLKQILSFSMNRKITWMLCLKIHLKIRLKRRKNKYLLLIGDMILILRIRERFGEIRKKILMISLILMFIKRNLKRRKQLLQNFRLTILVVVLIKMMSLVSKLALLLVPVRQENNRLKSKKRLIKMLTQMSIKLLK